MPPITIVFIATGLIVWLNALYFLGVGADQKEGGSNPLVSIGNATLVVGLLNLVQAVYIMWARPLDDASVVLAGLVTFYGLFHGPTRDTYLLAPAQAGAIVAQAPAPEGIMWVAPGIPTPRWVSYYLDVPVWTIEQRYADRVGPGDLVLARTDRTRDWIVLPGESVLEEGHYRLVAGNGPPDR